MGLPSQHQGLWFVGEEIIVASTLRRKICRHGHGSVNVNISLEILLLASFDSEFSSECLSG
jgi:hypothetical protein